MKQFHDPFNYVCIIFERERNRDDFETDFNEGMKEFMFILVHYSLTNSLKLFGQQQSDIFAKT